MSVRLAYTSTQGDVIVTYVGKDLPAGDRLIQFTTVGTGPVSHNVYVEGGNDTVGYRWLCTSNISGTNTITDFASLANCRDEHIRVTVTGLTGTGKLLQVRMS